MDLLQYCIQHQGQIVLLWLLGSPQAAETFIPQRIESRHMYTYTCRPIAVLLPAPLPLPSQKGEKLEKRKKAVYLGSSVSIMMHVAQTGNQLHFHLHWRGQAWQHGNHLATDSCRKCPVNKHDVFVNLCSVRLANNKITKHQEKKKKREKKRGAFVHMCIATWN